MCALNYPQYVNGCRVCGGHVFLISNEGPTPDLEGEIDRRLASIRDEADRVVGWRVECLVKAGASVRLAERIAAHREIDLHYAVRLVENAGPDTAKRILF